MRLLIILKAKNSMKRIIISGSTLGVLLALPAKAVCPVCVVAVGAGLGLSRYLGIDDVITGVWIGGLTIAVSLWTINWLRKKIKAEKYKSFYSIITIVAYYALVFWPLLAQNLVGHPLNTLWGIDKVILGLVLGTISFWSMSEFYLYLKKKNGGHAHFPFQKVVMPFGALIVLSGLFYLITR